MIDGCLCFNIKPLGMVYGEEKKSFRNYKCQFPMGMVHDIPSRMSRKERRCVNSLWAWFTYSDGKLVRLIGNVNVSIPYGHGSLHVVRGIRLDLRGKVSIPYGHGSREVIMKINGISEK